MKIKEEKDFVEAKFSENRRDAERPNLVAKNRIEDRCLHRQTIYGSGPSPVRLFENQRSIEYKDKQTQPSIMVSLTRTCKCKMQITDEILS